MTAFNINFDSLSEAYGFPKNFRDPSFFQVADRFLELAQKYNFKYTIFIVGKDLENYPDRQKAVKSWADEGHEIGNHSWQHLCYLGSLPYEKIYEEVNKSHQIIKDVTGIDPKGFIAPSWSNSKCLQKVLLDLNYEYDTSRFPSLLLYPMLAKMLVNHIGHPRFSKILRRKDYLDPLKSSKTYKIEKHEGGKVQEMISLPLPIDGKRFGLWHTLSFQLGLDNYLKIIRKEVKNNDYFYYLMHPADLMGEDDLNGLHKTGFERASVSLKKKTYHLEKAINLVLEKYEEGATMLSLARKAKEDHCLMRKKI